MVSRGSWLGMWRCGLAVIAVLVCAGCGAGSAIAPSAAVPAAGAHAGAVEYLLGTGDKVKVNVFGEESLSGEFEVGAAGTIEMPLVGPIRAAGISTRTFSENLTTSLRSGGYVRDPKVSAEVLNYRPFFILGEVTKAGEYPYRNGMSIMSAVATAGGFTYRANTRSVLIQRASESAPRSYPVATSVLVLPGDIVTIQERYF